MNQVRREHEGPLAQRDRRVFKGQPVSEGLTARKAPEARKDLLAA